MVETIHVRYWAIIAPLAALAGLAWTFYRKKERQKDKFEEEENNRLVAKVTKSVDPAKDKKIHNLSYEEPSSDMDTGYKTPERNSENLENTSYSTNDSGNLKDMDGESETDNLIESLDKEMEVIAIGVDKLEKPLIVEDVIPNVADNKPGVEDIQPEVGDTESEVNDSEPDVEVINPKVEVNEPEIVSTEPEVISTEPEKIFAKPEVDDIQPGVEELQPEVEDIELEIVQNEQKAVHSQPEAVQSLPEVILSQPKVEQPEVSHIKPEVDDIQPDEVNTKLDDIKPDVDEKFENEIKEWQQFLTNGSHNSSHVSSRIENEDENDNDKELTNKSEAETSYELVEVQTAPAALCPDVVENEIDERSDKSDEKSFDIINDDNDINLDDTEDINENSESESKALTTIEEITEATICCGESAALKRVRTQSELEVQDWTNSPVRQRPVTPSPEESERNLVFIEENDNPIKSKNTPKRRDVRKERKKLSNGDAFERDSSTTPDSAKDHNSVSSSGKRKSRKRKNKKNKKSEKNEKTEKNEKAEMIMNDEDHDSGAHSSEENQWITIEGFPTNLIGALIGKNGKHIKALQKDSKCKIVVRQNPYDDNSQIISIEGKSKNITTAQNMLNKRFPEIKLQPHTVEVLQSPTEPPYSDLQIYDQGYQGTTNYGFDYNQFYDYEKTTPQSNQNLQLVLGVPVEVRVTALPTANSPNKLWLHLYTHQTNKFFQKLEAEMSEVYNNDDGTYFMDTYLELGSFAVAPLHSNENNKSTEKWYRIQIISYPNDYEVMVVYLDWGEYATYPIEMVKQIRPDFLNLPFQAVYCVLDQIEMKSNELSALTASNINLQQILTDIPRDGLRAVVKGSDESGLPLVELTYEETIKNGNKTEVQEKSLNTQYLNTCPHIQRPVRKDSKPIFKSKEGNLRQIWQK